MSVLTTTRCSALMAASLLVILTSCADQQTPTGNVPAPISSAAAIIAPLPPPALPTPQSAVAPTEQQKSMSIRPLGEVHRGTGAFVGTSAPSKTQDAVPTDGITLNFVNADVREVIKAVLGDFLNLNYAIDPTVQGQVSIQTNSPLAQDTVLPVLEQTLRLNGLAISHSGDIYRVGPLTDAARQTVLQSGRKRARQPGFGTTIAQLHYVSVNEMKRLLEPIFPSGGIIHTDSSRNLLILSGTEQERTMMMENIALFDIDWLSGMSFALFTPRNVDVKVLAQELEQIIGGKESPLAGLVRFVQIPRMNGMLVISPQPEYLDELKIWVERLDQTGEGADLRIYVYPVQNGRAADIAAVLTKVVGSEKRPAKITLPVGDESAMVQAVVSSSPQTLNAPRGGEKNSVGSEGVSIRGLGDINITADDINNALVIMATPKDYKVIESALRQLDAAPLQVLLEAAVAEVTLTNDLRYGVQYYFQRNHHQTIRTASSTLGVSPTLPGFAYVFSNNDIKVVLDALENVTRVNVISSPQVLVLNNQTASLQVGDEVPIATQQAVSTTTAGAPVVNSIQYKNTGIILKVTPRVNQGGMVMVDVAQEVSDVAPTTSSTLDSPTIQQRKISSTISVQDGETIALGGLIKDSKKSGDGGIPIMKDIPGLGFLFGSTSNNTTRTELLVLITPHVVDNMQRARSITDELRQRLPAAQLLLPQPILPAQVK